jgi:acyl-CoA oxidase
MRIALNIAIRYSVARRQFSAPGKEIENPIWDYPAQRYRLLPRLAEFFAINSFAKWIANEYVLNKKRSSGKLSRAAEAEIHSISSSSKPFASYTTRDAIQECREACGGHGYASVNRFGQLRDDNDPNVTYEGENRVLLQQTARYILKGLELFKSDSQKIELLSPLGSLKSLAKLSRFVELKNNLVSEKDLSNEKFLIEAFEWRFLNLLLLTVKRMKTEAAKSKSSYLAFNNSQVFYAQSLAFAYIELLVLEKYFESLQNITHQNTRSVLHEFGVLFALNQIVKDLGNFRDKDFISSSQAIMIKDHVMNLCDKLKDDAIALNEAIAFPDHILQSPIGLSNGQPYLNYFTRVVTAESYARPEFWKKFGPIKPRL